MTTLDKALAMTAAEKAAYLGFAIEKVGPCFNIVSGAEVLCQLRKKELNTWLHRMTISRMQDEAAPAPAYEAETAAPVAAQTEIQLTLF